jgi:Ca2+-binding EF-hand superfamily protein
MTEEEVAAILTKFDQADTRKTGQLDFYAFKVLAGEVLQTEDEPTIQHYFDGIDIDNSKAVGGDEFTAFVVAALSGDKNYTLKLIFRAFDKDRSRALDAAEVKAVGKYAGTELSDEEIQAGIEKITGKKDGTLSYAQVVKLLTGTEIDPTTDPYDGKLKKSGCCLIF